ncbi:MAG: hypothetical protein ABFS38_04545 [Bacteroidota bacterium]
MKSINYIITAIIFVAYPTMLTGQKSVYTFPFENSYRLPSMQTKINAEEIAATYQTMGNIYTTEITGIGDDKMEQTSMSFISDAKVVDAVRFLEFYMEEELLEPGDGSSGIVEMSIIYYHEQTRINAGTVLGVLTFGLGTLFGIPYATAVVDVETSATFYNEQEIPITTHRGVGRGKKLQSLYSMSTRKAHQRALKDALEELNFQVMMDSDLPNLVAN